MTTFTDELIELGFNPDKDAVIVKVDFGNAESLEDSMDIGFDVDKPIAPLFDHTIFEWAGTLQENGETALTTSVIYATKVEHLAYAVVAYGKARLVSGGATIYYATPKDRYSGFKLDGDYYLSEMESLVAPTFERPIFGTRLLGDIDGGELITSVLNVIWFLQELSTEHDVELVEPTRQQKKRAERENKKPPSPYVRMSLKKTRRVLSSHISQQAHKTPRALHRVAGHFKRFANHPFIPDGTYYVHPHLRGSKDQGDVRRNYKVVLS